MDKTKSITIIAVTIIVVAGVVAITAIYFSSKNAQDNKVAPRASEVSSDPTTFIDTDNPISRPEALLSLSMNSPTKRLLTATCEVPAGFTCDLWGTSNGTDALIYKSVNATPENIEETGKTQYTWDMSSGGLQEKYTSFFGRAYSASGTHITDSTKTQP